MSAFRAVAGNSTQPLSKTYIPAAKQLNLGMRLSLLHFPASQANWES